MTTRPVPIVGRAGQPLRRQHAVMETRSSRPQMSRVVANQASVAVRTGSSGAAAPGLLARLRTVEQLAAECPALSVRTLRYWISRADELGLGRAVLRVGRKVLVDVEQFERWLSVL